MGGLYDDVIIDDSPQAEMEMYFAEPPSHQMLYNPLAWWKANQSKYPLLAELAKMLAIPSTSTPSERVFSAAGNTIISKRASLDGDTVDELVFLHLCLSKKGSNRVANTKSSVSLPALPVAEVKKEITDQVEAHSNESSGSEHPSAENNVEPTLPASPPLSFLPKFEKIDL